MCTECYGWCSHSLAQIGARSLSLIWCLFFIPPFSLPAHSQYGRWMRLNYKKNVIIIKIIYIFPFLYFTFILILICSASYHHHCIEHAVRISHTNRFLRSLAVCVCVLFFSFTSLSSSSSLSLLLLLLLYYPLFVLGLWKDGKTQSIACMFFHIASVTYTHSVSVSLFYFCSICLLLDCLTVFSIFI